MKITCVPICRECFFDFNVFLRTFPLHSFVGSKGNFAENVITIYNLFLHIFEKLGWVGPVEQQIKFN